MKATIGSMTLSGLLFTVVAVTAGPAVSAPFTPLGADSSLLLAESGSEQLGEHQMLQKQRMQAYKEDPSKGFVQMMEEEPSAAGPQDEADKAQPKQQPMHQYGTPSQRRTMSEH